VAKKSDIKEKTSFSELDEIISSEFSELVDISKTDNDVKNWFSLGNYALNYACSKRLTGGIPSGRITSFWGLSSTGKSLLMAGLAKDPQVDMVVVLSAEGGGISKSIFDFIGAPVDKVRYLPVTTFTNYRVSKENASIEEIVDKDMPMNLETDKYIYHKGLINIMKKFISQIEHKGVNSNIVILLDSIANVKSVREFAGTCFVGDTLVKTATGFKKIKDVTVGEEVLTHLNSYKRVEEKKEFIDKKEIIEIETENGIIEVTPEHPFLVRRDGKTQWIEAGELSIEDELLKII